MTDLFDKSGFIHAIGQKLAKEAAIQQAQVEVAEQKRKGARHQKVVAVPVQQAKAAVGQKDDERPERVQMAAA